MAAASEPPGGRERISHPGTVVGAADQNDAETAHLRGKVALSGHPALT
jgi:hypothetical protein